MTNDLRDEASKPLTKELIDRLRDYIAAERGRGREIAAALGVEPSSVSDWTNGRTVPDLEHGLRIQQILRRKRVPRRGLDVESQSTVPNFGQ